MSLWRRRRLGARSRTIAATPQVGDVTPSHEDAPSTTEPPTAPFPGVRGVLDPAVSAQLEQDGYARLGRFLDAHQVGAARALFDEAFARLGRPVGDEWFPTILLPDDDVRSYITDGLTSIIAPGLASVLDLNSLDLVRLDYSVKPASPTSGLGPHQDFSLIDEDRATSLYLWIPLSDSDEHNGTLHVVPGSHRFSNRIRSRHVPAVFDEVLDLVSDAAVRLDCAVGELIVMVSGVIHFSPPNLSDELRLAVHGIVKPTEAPLVFFFADDATPADQVECYEVEIEHYVRQIHQGRPGDGLVPSHLAPRPPSSMSPSRFRRGMEEYGASLTD